MAFLGLLLGNKSVVAIGILILVLAGMGIYIKVLKSDVELCEKEKVVLTEKLALSQDAVRRLQAGIEEQNAAIQKMKTAADERAKVNQAELARAQATAGAFRQQAADILKSVAPQGVPKCDAANLLINSELQRAK